jgi:mono/diheme cytochrome c family protein
MANGNRPLRYLVVAGGLLALCSLAAWAIVTNLSLVKQIHPPTFTHMPQSDLLNLVKAGQGAQAFENAFDHGDAIFNNPFNAVDGVGANVGQGLRFTRVPRADLTGPGQWATHTPPRATGPNSQACGSCHGKPVEDGAGGPEDMAVRDPQHSGRLNAMITRDTPHLLGLGATQRLAEEMTTILLATRVAAIVAAKAGNKDVTVNLTAKGVSFGSITAHADGSVDLSKLQGVDTDLVVKPFQWKGSVPFIRAFVRDAANNELGMQGVEIVGDNVDGDGDGVVNELLVGDITAITIYNAAQPRPTTRVELASLGLIPPLSSTEASAIQRGEAVFKNVQCATCHIPSLTLLSPIFNEPSKNPFYRDSKFPAGQDPVARGLDPQFPVSFDLTKDHTENIIKDSNGNIVKRLGDFDVDGNGHAIIRLFGDLKRHDMGSGLAESIDEVGTGASVWMTRNLWGVGSTAPYLHDGRATTLTEAILEHGGEAAASKNAFVALTLGSQKDLIAYLNNLVLFKLPE